MNSQRADQDQPDYTPPMTDSEIEAATVGNPVQHNDRITLIPYQPQWAEQFERLAATIRSALGDRALAIAHVGSTAVPGLSAKPIIDVVLTVADAADEDNYVDDLIGAGFKLQIREPEWFEHRVLQNPNRNRERQADEIDCNIHVFSAGCPEIERMVAFRDWLRRNEKDRLAYEQVKQQLAAKQWRYVQNYADAKSGIVNQILGRALSRQGPLSD